MQSGASCAVASTVLIVAACNTCSPKVCPGSTLMAIARRMMKTYPSQVLRRGSRRDPPKAPAPAPAVKKAEPVAKVVAEDVVKLPTKTVLSKMTKKEIDNLAQVDFGVTLDARVTKDKMISALQKEVKAQKK